MLRCPVTLTGHPNAPGCFLKHVWKPARPPQKNNSTPDGILSGAIAALRGTRYRIARGGVTFVAGEFG